MAAVKITSMTISIMVPVFMKSPPCAYLAVRNRNILAFIAGYGKTEINFFLRNAENPGIRFHVI